MGEQAGTTRTEAGSEQRPNTRTSADAGTEADAAADESIEGETDTTGTGGTTATGSGTESGETTSCDERRRLAIDLPGEYELAYHEGFGFRIDAQPSELALGDDLTVRFENAADSERTTGPRSAYAIERQVEDGWQHVLWVPGRYSLPDKTVTHDPGEGFLREVLFTQEGLSQGPFRVCEPLQPGVYHFTYFGSRRDGAGSRSSSRFNSTPAGIVPTWESGVTPDDRRST